MNTNLNPINNRVLALQTRISGLDEATLTKLCEKLEKVGVTDLDEIVSTLTLCKDFKTSVPSIVRWMADDDMSLAQIERTLVVRQCFQDDDIRSLSVAALHRLLQQLPGQSVCIPQGGFRRTANGVTFAAYGGLSMEAETIISTLLEALDGGQFPVQHLLHIVEERFGGDIYAAYNLVNDDEEMFTAVANGRRSLLEARVTMVPDAFFINPDQLSHGGD